MTAFFRTGALVGGALLCMGGVGQPQTTAVAKKAAAYRAPRNAEGQPDLQGVWQARNTAYASVEDHSAALGIPGGRGVVVDPPGVMIPYLPDALKKRDANFAARATADPMSKCYLPGVPRVMYLPFPVQIFQTAGFVVIASEYAHTVRTVHLTGSHPDEIEFWMGDSRGKYEGDTLVIDVTNQNANTWLDQSGNHHSEQLHVVERLRRTSPDVITYEATIEDPKVYSKPWKISMPLYRNPDKHAQLLEYECHVYAEDEAAAKAPKK
jgi:hypothetical protein